jgi:hypothetical protein
MSPRGGWCREGGAALAVEQDAIKREAEPACKGAERVYLSRGSSKERRRCRACKLCCPKGPPSPSALVGERMITQKGVFGIVQGHANRHLAIDPKDGALFVGVGSSGNIGVEPEIKASIQRSVELPRQSSATSRTII